MSGSSTPERDSGLLAVGQQCSHSSCMLVDFLPIKCQHCSHAFCSEHFLPEAHKCDKFDAYQHDRVAPPCPFCRIPIAIPPGQDPNIRMEAHFNTECSVITGKARKSSRPTCARAKCGKVLYAPIRCDKCKQQFYPQHRFPTSHTCTSGGSTASAAPSARSQLSASSAAAMSAIQRAMASTNISTPASVTTRGTTSQTRNVTQPPVMGQSSSSNSTRSSSSTRSNPFSATDRRAKAERASRRHAIANRAKKGLPLTEEEEAILAEGPAKDDCVIM